MKSSKLFGDKATYATCTYIYKHILDARGESANIMAHFIFAEFVDYLTVRMISGGEVFFVVLL